MLATKKSNGVMTTNDAIEKYANAKGALFELFAAYHRAVIAVSSGAPAWHAIVRKLHDLDKAGGLYKAAVKKHPELKAL